MKQMTGFERGVNLGGWMSHENYEQAHLDSYILEEDIARIASWGLDHVRIPVDYNLFEAQGDEEPRGYACLDRAMAWCRKHGLHVVLDLHKTAGFSYEAMFHESGFFDDEGYQNRFYALWEAFAARYAAEDDSVAFELLNEVTDPAFMPAWNRIAAEAIRRIRRIAPISWILVGSYHNNAVEALPALDLPADDHLVYNYHCYDPFLFTHQAAFWVQDMKPDFRLDYPVTPAQYQEAAQRLLGDEKARAHALGQPLDANYFISRFADAVKLAEEKNVALYCGEYGVIEHAADEAVLRWYRDIHQAFAHFGIARAAWSYKRMNFGVIDRPAIMDELVKLL